MSIRLPTEDETATLDRQLEWRQRSVERLKAERVRRRTRLEREDVAEGVRRALEAYKELDDPDSAVQLRTAFVARREPRPLPPALGGPEPEDDLDADELRQEDYRTRPPLTKLVMRRTSALPTYLSLLYVAQAEGSALQPGRRNARANVTRRDGRAAWAVVTGRWASTARARRARLARDLDELARADLVEIGASQQQGRYEGFGLLSDAATGDAYRPPDLAAGWPDIMSLPSVFFRRGWHLVLTPAEIATLLVARHADLLVPKSTHEPGTGIPQSARWATYGLSGEAYGSVHELQEFGLLTVHDTMPQRRHGKFRRLPADVRAEQEAEGESLAPVPYRLEPADDDAFDRPALVAVHACLLEHDAPPRLLDE
jgi:hypothetical protein